MWLSTGMRKWRSFHKKGQGNVVVDRVVYEVEEGDVMAVFPGQLHAIYGFEDQRMDYENIIFSLSLLMGQRRTSVRNGSFFLLPESR